MPPQIRALSHPQPQNLTNTIIAAINVWYV